MKRMRYKFLSIVLMAGILASVSACANNKKEQQTEEQTTLEQALDKQAESGQNSAEQTKDEETSGKSSAEEQANSTQTPEEQSETEKPEEKQEAEEQTAEEQAVEEQESEPVETVSAGALPHVTENPTDETLTEGYSCMYIASADNADKIEWRAVSPDGKVDISYSEIDSYFPYLEYVGEKGEAISLFNIPADFDGWGSYCRFTNSAGSVDSRHAVTHVRPMQNDETEKSEQQPAQAEQEEEQAEQEEEQLEQEEHEE